jgi:hypothetical protein
LWTAPAMRYDRASRAYLEAALPRVP